MNRPQTATDQREGRLRCHSRQSTGLPSSEGDGRRRGQESRRSPCLATSARLACLTTTARILQVAAAASSAEASRPGVQNHACSPSPILIPGGGSSGPMMRATGL